MRDTIACSDGKVCLGLISLSSRRRVRDIALMLAVKAGVLVATDQYSVTIDLNLREG